MAKTFRPYDPDQVLLLPASLRDWLPSEHLVYFVSDVAETLDLNPIYQAYQEERGYPPYHPLLMTKLLLYGYVRGVRSSRKLARACLEAVDFRILAAGQQPDFRTIAAFRARHLDALEGFLQQVLKLCREAGLVQLSHVAVDVTQQANDKNLLLPMLEQVESNTGRRPEEVSADAGYWVEAEIEEVEERGTEAFVAPEKITHREWHEAKPPRGRIPKGLSKKELMSRKLRTKRGRTAYDKRKVTAEPVFGQMKAAMGFDRFLLRGHRKVQGEWSLACTAHNMLKLFRSGWRTPTDVLRFTEL